MLISIMSTGKLCIKELFLKYDNWYSSYNEAIWFQYITINILNPYSSLYNDHWQAKCRVTGIEATRKVYGFSILQLIY